MKRNIKWIIIFIILCIVCAAVWVYRSKVTTDYCIAQINQNGKIIKTIDLSLIDEPYEFVIKDELGGSNTIRAEKNKIAVIDADCPDKICMKQGFVSDGTVPIVCLPHKLVITITGESGEYDAVAGGN